MGIFFGVTKFQIFIWECLIFLLGKHKMLGPSLPVHMQKKLSQHPPRPKQPGRNDPWLKRPGKWTLLTAYRFHSALLDLL